MSKTSTVKPVNINLHQKSRVLEVEYEDGTKHQLPCEYLRVYSPSAEVTGHGPGQEVLQLNKEEVGIEAIEPMGNYALKFRFDDKHDTGLYTWTYLYELGANYEANWQHYLERLKAAGHERRKID
ncbi:MAG: DUF971 domain-containing protein [Gammaproteobacteria bacterium]|nr:DUF971 domain-containing protein [Gammaproteobacteria bacterium]